MNMFRARMGLPRQQIIFLEGLDPGAQWAVQFRHPLQAGLKGSAGPAGLSGFQKKMDQALIHRFIVRVGPQIFFSK